MGARVALVVLALSGCDQLLGLQKITPLADAAIDAPPPPPRAHYTFEQVAGGATCLHDDTGNGHDGTCAQGTPTIVDGPPGHGQAFAFDGATYITIPYAADLDAPSGFTVTMWVAIDGYDPARGFDCIINRIYGTMGGDTWQLCVGPQNGFFAVSDGSVNTPPLTTAWTHLGLVFDGNHVASWVDGELMSLNYVPMAAAYDPTVGIWIGADAEPDPEVFFIGRIDDVYLYDRVLSADEIAALAR